MNNKSHMISGWVHDLWFDADALSAQIACGPRSVRIPLYEERSQAPVRHLVVENVDSIEINDSQNVRWYDINSIKIEDDDSRAKLVGNIPITVVFRSDSRLRVRIDKGTNP
ncbi:MAG: hypothetical protein H6813_01985 [Phycisphaeraceae bacterium]|nr:hypothetical protein [Phycisphaeraceae bacterium]